MLLAPSFLPFMDINIVSASEEEEVDYFSNMPNFRWTNESTTSDTEEMIDSGYSVDTTNLNITDNAKFEKSRLLNSRDMFMESRFALDNGGNQTEYFRDIIGDSADFSEDTDGWENYDGGSISVSDGILTKIFASNVWSGIDYDLQPYQDNDQYVSYEVYGEIRIRYMVSVACNLRLNTWDVGEGDYTSTEHLNDIIGEWTEISLFPIYDYNRVSFQKWSQPSEGFLYIDWIKILGNLDYATHAEGEIEDTWDWEDSNEFFFNEMDNVSDFNDGTGENWTTFDVGGDEGFNFPDFGTDLGGFYNPDRITASDDSRASCTVTSGDRTDSMDAYDFDFSIPAGATIIGIEGRIEAKGIIGKLGYCQVHLTRDGIGWVTTESQQEITNVDAFYYFGGSTDLWGETWLYSDMNDNVNFRARLDAIWGSGVTGHDIDFDSFALTVYYEITATTALSVSNGWANLTATVATDLLEIERTGLSIDSSVYGWMTIEFYVESGTVDYIQMRDDVYGLGVDNTNRAEGEYFLFSMDLDNDADWSGTETRLEIEIKFIASLDTNAIDLNMTYLYDVELGDIEGVGYSFDRDYVNPNGYYTTTIPVGSIDHIGWTNLVIDSSNFNTIKFSIRVGSDIQFKIKGRPIGLGDVDLSSYENIVSNGFETYEVDLSLDSDWNGQKFDRIYLTLIDDSGNFEGNELVQVDYVLLTGEFSASKFKFSLLDHQKTELGYFGFGRHNETFYNFSIDFFDSIGSYLTYESSFLYTSPEWLRFDLELDLDKKNMKLELDYDNGSEIFDLDLYDAFGYLGRQLPVLFKGGWFPSLCLNNSMLPMSRSAFVIDFINANYDIVSINQLADAEWSGLALTNTYEQNFETGKYGLFIDGYESVEDVDIYTMNIDKFDGFNFEIFMDSTDLDENDFVVFGMAIFNIQTNGTPYYLSYNMGGIEKQATTTEYHASMLGYAGYALKTVDSTDDLSMSIKFSWYHENFESLTNQMIFSVDGTQELASSIEFNAEDLNIELTKEYQFLWWWYSDNSASGFADDVIEASMGGIDITRKDFLGELAGAIIKPFVDVLSLIFAPLILLLQFLAFVFKGVGEFIVEALRPILAVIGDLVVGIVSVLGNIATDLGNLAGTLTTAIGNIASAVWTSIGNALDFITDAIILIGGQVITALISQLGTIVDSALDFLITYITLVTQIYELLIDWTINTFILPLITDFFDGMGLGWLLDDLLVLIENLGDVIINLVAGAMALLAWLVITIVWIVNNAEMIGLILFLFIFFFLFRPMIFFLENPFEDWFTSQGIDQIEATASRMKDTFLILVNFIIKFFELIFKLLTTIGSYIPFT